jgi:DNA-binding Lrp family transcriptional regulator
LKDKRILLALDMNARKPDTQISKIVGLSKQITNYRIKRLEKQQIIQSYYPVIDHTKLGLKLYRIALKLENTTKDKEIEILNYLKKHASWITSVLGVWDISMGIYVKDEYDFMKFWKTFYEKYGFYIEDRWISLMTLFWNFERSFIFLKKKDRAKQFILGEQPEKVKIDLIDEKIMQELTKNARQTTLDIAGKIKQTERIVRYRLKRLENQKVILGYRPFLNINLLNLKYFKIYVQLKEAKIQDIRKIRSYIINNPNIVYSTEALGGYDFELEAHFSSSQELFEFISNLKEQFPKNIRNISHVEYIKEYKVTYFPTAN